METKNMTKKETRFTGLNKTKRDRRVKRFHEAHPDASFQEIGDKFGITKQMVSLILKTPVHYCRLLTFDGTEPIRKVTTKENGVMSANYIEDVTCPDCRKAYFAAQKRGDK
jgi:hypothetical protein